MSPHQVSGWHKTEGNHMICWGAWLSSTGTRTGWRNGSVGTSWNLMKTNTKSCADGLNSLKGIGSASWTLLRGAEPEGRDYPLYSVLVRPCVVTAFSFGPPNTAKILMNLIFEGVWQRPKRWWGLDHLSREERLGKLNLFCLEHKQLGGGLESSPQCIQGHWGDTAGIFMMVCGRRTEDNRHKMKWEVQTGYKENRRLSHETVKLVQSHCHWRFSGPSLNNLVWVQCWPWTRDFQDPLQPEWLNDSLTMGL